MKLIRYFFCIFFPFVLFSGSANANVSDIAEEFNNLILNYHDLEYPYLEERNDIGIFYDFSYDEKLRKVIIKRDKKNYPVLRFSLFNKNDLKQGDIIVKYNDKDLSKLNDEELLFLHKKNNNVRLTLKDNRIIDLKPFPYKLNDIKLSNFYLDYINTIDTTRGVLEISFYSSLTNRKPELEKYADGLLGDEIYYISDDLYDSLYLPIDNVIYDEYKYDVDIRKTFRPEFSYDKGILKTIKQDEGIAQFRQKFNFEKFPFDSQKLKIKILTQAENTADPEINWPKGTASVTFVTPETGAFLGLINYKKKNILKEMGWEIISTDIVSKEIIEKNKYDLYLEKVYEGSQNSIELVIEIKRNAAHYVFKIIIPVFLILCVAWSVLWIPTPKLDARLTTSIVALLALIAYNFVFEGDIPKLDYLTDLDKFILLSYVFCCIPTFSSIGFSRLIKKTDKLQIRATKINSVIRKWGAVIYLLIFLQIFKPFI